MYICIEKTQKMTKNLHRKNVITLPGSGYPAPLENPPFSYPITYRHKRIQIARLVLMVEKWTQHWIFAVVFEGYNVLFII